MNRFLKLAALVILGVSVDLAPAQAIGEGRDQKEPEVPKDKGFKDKDLPDPTQPGPNFKDLLGKSGMLIKIEKAKGPGKILALVDLRNAPVGEVMRQLSLETGLNIVPSAEANGAKINLFLTNVAPELLLTALTKSNKLVANREVASGIISIFTEKEEADRNEKEGKTVKGKEGKKSGLDQSALDILSKIVIRGRVLEPKQTPAVLLEINGKLRLLKKGGEFAFNGQTSVRVVEITPDAVELLIMPLNQRLVLY